MPAEMGREYLSEHVPSPHLREYYLMSSAFPSSSGFPPGGEDGRKASLTLRAIGEQPLAFGGDRGIKESNPDLGARKRAIGGTGAPRVAIGMDQKEASVERRRARRRRRWWWWRPADGGRYRSPVRSAVARSPFPPRNMLPCFCKFGSNGVCQ